MVGWPAGLALKAIRKGWVRVDGRRARPQQRLRLGEELRSTRPGLSLSAPEPERIAVPAAAIEEARRAIIAAEPELVALNKPFGRPVHRGSGHPFGLCDALAAVLDEDRLAPIGRLDRDTTGVLIVARGRAAARALDAALRRGGLDRRYEALVFGRPKTGRIDRPLATKSGPEGRQRSQVDAAGARALTEVLAVEEAGPAALVQVRIETGRTHQIRAHLAAEGHPLLGDPRYASPASQALSERAGVDRLMLHARRCRLCVDGQAERRFEAPRPEAWDAALRRLRALEAA